MLFLYVCVCVCVCVYLLITNNLETAGALYTVLAQYHDKLVGLGSYDKCAGLMHLL